MASDLYESCRRHHRRTSDEYSPENSKRHKHRRHRHRRSKHEEEKKDEIDTEIKDDVAVVTKLVDYDMEEGEIVDDGGISVAEEEIVDQKVDFDVEPGEFDDCDMRGNTAVGNSLVDLSRKSTRILKSPRSGDHKNRRSQGNLDESPESMSIENVESRKRSSNGDKSHGRSKSLSKRSGTRHHCEKDEGILENCKVHDRLDIERGSYVRADCGLESNGRAGNKRRERQGGDREGDTESGMDKVKAREANGEMDWDGELKSGKCGPSRGRNYETERRRDARISSYRDRNAGRETDRKLKDRAGNSCRVRDRHDDESGKSRRYHKYDDQDNGHGGRDRHHGYGDPEYVKDRNRKYESEKNGASKDVYIYEIDDANRDDEDQKSYQERVELKLAEQEEDNVDRIKEESRRRREAILQKYKAKQLQQQVVPPDAKAYSTAEGGAYDFKHGEEAFVVAKSFNVGKSPLKNEVAAVELSVAAVGLGEGLPKSEKSNDMFCDDIFGDSPAGISKTEKKMAYLLKEEVYMIIGMIQKDITILDCRYEITAAHGKGVFSTVVRTKDLKAGSCDPEEVAIKIIRNNETMLKAGMEELVILKKLVDEDPDDKRHCEVLKKFGRNIGIKLTAVRAYANQLFISLKHLRSCEVLHCDIKPDNMLVNDAKNVLKLCDFGNAMLAGGNEITPYLVSRFYRAPVIILGLPYDHPMDIWSVGCCLYELYTGKVLFPGATNNDMLRLHMEMKGSFPKKMLRKGAFIGPHFDQDFNFLATEEDPVTKKAIRRLICNIKPKDIGTVIKGSPGEDSKMLANFKDMLDKIFVLDPDKRLAVSQVLNHPFIIGKWKQMLIF